MFLFTARFPLELRQRLIKKKKKGRIILFLFVFFLLFDLYGFPFVEHFCQREGCSETNKRHRSCGFSQVCIPRNIFKFSSAINYTLSKESNG